MVHLILGGRRSGKTQFAENLAIRSGKTVHYIATAQIFDQEMAVRARAHQTARPTGWQTHEVPINLAQTILQYASAEHCLLIDCLTMWLTNMLCADVSNQSIAQARSALLDAIKQSQATLIFVSNETGLGVVPEGELTRRYCDEAGWLHQALAAQADHVALIVAGLPLTLKQPNEEFKR